MLNTFVFGLIALAETRVVPRIEEIKTSSWTGSPATPSLQLPLKRNNTRSTGLVARQAESLTYNPQRNGLLAEVTFGYQTFDLLVDTGSSDLWVVIDTGTCSSLGQQFPIDQCVDVGAALDVDDSIYLLEGESGSIQYVDGISASGQLAAADVTIAGITVIGQTFIAASSVGQPALGGASGFAGLSFANQNNYPALMWKIFDNGQAENYFALAVSRDESNSGNAGVLTVGALPANDGGQMYSASFTSSSSYTINVDGLSWSGPDGDTGVAGFSVIVDSGTQWDMVPSDVAASLNSQFDPPATLLNSGLYSVECDATPPDIGFYIGGGWFPYNSVDLIMPFTAFNPSGCASAIQATSGVNILGDPFHRNVLAVYDWGGDQMLFLSRPDYDS